MSNTTESSACNLCAEIAAEALDDQITAVASIGALAVGHALICPNNHATSIAVLAEPATDLLLGHAAEVGSHLERLIGRPVHIFEHGNATEGERVACSVEHAHMHLLPADADVEEDLDALATWRSLDWSAEALKSLSAGREYLLYRSPAGRARLWVTHDHPIPSQLMRRLMARHLGRESEWNWRDHPAPQRTTETQVLVRELLAERFVSVTA